jgi:hypothetical protein
MELFHLAILAHLTFSLFPSVFVCRLPQPHSVADSLGRQAFAPLQVVRSSPTTGRAPLPTSLTLIGPLPPEPLKTLPVLLRSRAILPYRAARNHPVYGG